MPRLPPSVRGSHAKSDYLLTITIHSIADLRFTGSLYLMVSHPRPPTDTPTESGGVVSKEPANMASLNSCIHLRTRAASYPSRNGASPVIPLLLKATFTPSIRSNPTSVYLEPAFHLSSAISHPSGYTVLIQSLHVPTSSRHSLINSTKSSSIHTFLRTTSFLNIPSFFLKPHQLSQHRHTTVLQTPHCKNLSNSDAFEDFVSFTASLTRSNVVALTLNVSLLPTTLMFASISASTFTTS